MQTCEDYTFEVSLSDERFIDKKISDAMIGSTSDYQNRLTRKEYGFKANRGVSFRRTEVTCTDLHSAIENGACFCSLFDNTKEIVRFNKKHSYAIRPRKDGSFSSSFKCMETFEGSYTLGVDIDRTSFRNVEEYVSCLSLEPTIYYTTYSNLQPDKGARFRLIYVFDRMIDNVYLYRYMTDSLNKIIEEDTCEFIYDKCNLISTQYFNGTCKNNDGIIYSSHNSNIIYSFNDMGYGKGDFINYLTRYCDYRTYDNLHMKNISSLLSSLTNKEYYYKDKRFYLKEEIRDIEEESVINEYDSYSSSINHRMEKRPREENNNGVVEEGVLSNQVSSINHRMEKRPREENNNGVLGNGVLPKQVSSINPEMEKRPRFSDINHLCSFRPSPLNPEIDWVFRDWDLLDEESFMKSRSWNKLRNETKYIYRMEKEEWINGIYQFVDDDYFRLPYIPKTRHDGEKRRITLYQRMCLRKVIKPTITYEELMVGTMIDILRFFDRDRENGDYLSSDFIKRNIDKCMSQPLEEIKSTYDSSINWLMKNTRPKRGIIYFNKQCHSKTNTFFILDDFYKGHMSIEENLYYINNILNYRISKSYVYEYLKDRDIKPLVKGRMTNEDAYKVIDINLSFNENKRLLKELYKDKGLSIGDKRLRKLIKLKKSEINDSSSINHKMEKRPRKEKNNDFLDNGEKTRQVSSINHEMEKRPRLSEEYDNNTSVICSASSVVEKESSYDSGTKNDSEENTLDIDNILGVEDEKVSCYEWDIELFDTEDKITYKTCLKDRNENTSEEIPVSAINDEFDQFQEELRIREKRLKNFVTFSVDDELVRLIEELNG